MLNILCFQIYQIRKCINNSLKSVVSYCNRKKAMAFQKDCILPLSTLISRIHQNFQRVKRENLTRYKVKIDQIKLLVLFLWQLFNVFFFSTDRFLYFLSYTIRLFLRLQSLLIMDFSGFRLLCTLRLMWNLHFDSYSLYVNVFFLYFQSIFISNYVGWDLLFPSSDMINNLTSYCR